MFLAVSHLSVVERLLAGRATVPGAAEHRWSTVRARDRFTETPSTPPRNVLNTLNTAGVAFFRAVKARWLKLESDVFGRLCAVQVDARAAAQLKSLTPLHLAALAGHTAIAAVLVTESARAHSYILSKPVQMRKRKQLDFGC